MDVKGAIRDCEMIFVSVNTPTKKTGLGKGKAADLTYWELAARTIATSSVSDKIIVEKSTVPVRTAEAIDKVLQRNCPNMDIRRYPLQPGILGGRYSYDRFGRSGSRLDWG